MPDDTTTPPSRSPALGAVLSLLLPGLGQLYTGERAKGIAVLCISLGTWLGMALSALGPSTVRSPLTVLMLAIVYLFIWIPSVIDAYRDASGRPSRLLSDGSAWYVIVMLLVVGPMAIPLLWQSRAFSRGSKIGWTVFVIAVALLIIVSLLAIGPAIERLLQDYPMLLDESPELRRLLDQLQ